MKKLLATLTSISTIGSIMPMILANVPTKTENNNLQAGNLESNKIETLSTNDYLEFNNKIIKKVDVLPELEEVKESILNNYFIKDNNFYFLKQDNNIPEKINGIESEINSWNKVIFNDKKNNFYIGTNDGLYTLKYGETTAIKLNITNDINIDFGIIDNNDNIYIGTDGENSSLSESLYIIKNNVLVRINGIEQTLGSYPGESSESNRIAIDSKNNVYVVGYSKIIYIL
ncbi:SBBP repeat-containing protein [Spiroplasma endosymbiont of Agriotes lineatus]|uniref:SBBP repeat-containing protein n=1 Tax=Spiroplasma endosymbiont of Agriotes lineatus TaxID=3077930 RepID=UPI0030D47EEA